jgi:prephenate dehydrogenase
MKTAVNGLGLIGGSIAKELNRQASPFEVYGIDSSELHVSKAIELGLVRSTLSLDEAINRCTQMILAVPADKIQALAIDVLDRIGAHHIVFDVGSTKDEICKTVAAHTMRHRFVAAHPLADTEFSGPEATHLNLFRGKKNIICGAERSDDDALILVSTMFKTSRICLINLILMACMMPSSGPKISAEC